MGCHNEIPWTGLTEIYFSWFKRVEAWHQDTNMVWFSWELNSWVANGQLLVHVCLLTVKEVTVVWCLFPQGKSLSEGSTLAISAKLITFQSSHPHTIILEVKTLMPTFGEAQMFSITVCFSGILLGLFCSPWKFWILTTYMAEPGGNTGEQWQTREQFEMSPWLGRKIPLNPVCPFPSLLFFLSPYKALCGPSLLLPARICQWKSSGGGQRTWGRVFPLAPFKFLLLLWGWCHPLRLRLQQGHNMGSLFTPGWFPSGPTHLHPPTVESFGMPSPLFWVPWTLSKTLWRVPSWERPC